jgi:hypothetical protein
MIDDAKSCIAKKGRVNKNVSAKHVQPIVVVCWAAIPLASTALELSLRKLILYTIPFDGCHIVSGCHPACHQERITKGTTIVAPSYEFAFIDASENFEVCI